MTRGMRKAELGKYTNNGVTAKLRGGEGGWFQVKIFGDNTSAILYEGFDEEEARDVWSLITNLVV